MLTGLRFKLFAAFASLLVLLLAMGGLAMVVLDRNAAITEAVLRENFRSVGFGLAMKDALREMDHAEADNTGRLDSLRQEFERNLQLEKGNLTLPGEAELADSLDKIWVFVRRADSSKYFGRAEDLARRIVDLNLGNILAADGKLHRTQRDARTWLMLLLMSGGALSIVLGVLAARWIVRPIRRLTESVREIGRGNLDLVVSHPSKDELGELATAFNTMAARLREVRDRDRRRLWRALRATQAALDSLPDGVVVLLSDGRIEIANAVARKVFGLEPGGVFPIAQISSQWSALGSALASGKPWDPSGNEVVVQRFENGLEQFFTPRFVPLPDPMGGFSGGVLVLADITQARKIRALQGDALSVVAHELRTPLTSLRMASHLLLDERLGELNDAHAELATSIRQDAARLETVIEEILDLSRADAGKLVLRTRSIELPAMLEAVVEAQASEAAKRGVRLVLEASAQKIEVDPERLQMAIGNLVSNSIRFSAPGTEILLSGSVERKMVHIRVVDHGAGIAASDLPFVFDRFWRASGQDSGSGVGLGLALAREIVLAHGGAIVVTSNPGKETVFQIDLPLEETPR